tara:strand:+ start:407 stop:808 length:402 start_codon:yes stop_codon:yes gene_type:complete
MQTINEITANDLVMTKEGNTVMSGGYKIDNIFLQNNISPLSTNNSSSQQGGNLSSLFSNLAVPAGLLLLQQKTKKTTFTNMYNKASDKVIDSTLYDKLLDVSNSKKQKKLKEPKKKTRTSKKKTKRKTKKNRS